MDFLGQYAFDKITSEFGFPDIDLFATLVNTKCKTFVYPERYALATDAFTINWSTYFFYAFPPFAMILKMLNKIIHDKAKGIVIVPHWPIQPWYPVFKSLIIGKELIFESNNLLIESPFRTRHRLSPHLSLIAAIVCGKPTRKNF